MAKPPIKAQELADRLAEAIESGELPPGRYLPPERAMALEHDVARSVINRAVGMLADRGLIELRKGSSPRVIGPTTATALDATAVHGELAAIRAELREMNDRLRALEAASTPEPGR
jgi:GntR family transcriptional regulator, transcriptional repressor for pyruvate dehydrogenase complex